MAGAKLRNVLCHISNLVATQQAEGSPDQELLTRFLTLRDESAFAAIMERHGPMVLGVCERVLRNAHDAEDACQAVFLVLARKAASLRQWESLGSWLYGVAWRVSRKLQISLDRQSTRETLAATQKPTVSEPANMSWLELRRLVDEELNRLHEIYKAPLVLCHLEGMTKDEAARELGWSVGVLRGRLERGRAKLRARLLRRGVTGSAAIAGAALVPALSSAAVPPTLVVSTVNVSLDMAAGTMIPAAVPANVAHLAQMMLQAPLWTPLRIALAVCSFLAVAAIVAALGLLRENTAGSVAAKPKEVEVWTETSLFEGQKSRPRCVAFSPDGKLLACGSGGPGELKVYEADTGALLYALVTPRAVRCIAFAPDGNTLATAEHDGIARLRETSTGKVLRTFEGHSDNIDTVSFSLDGRTLATSSWDKSVKLWNTATGREKRTLVGHGNPVFATAFGGPEGTLASCGAGAEARIWQPATGATLFTLTGHRDSVHWLAYSPDRKLLATASWDKTVKLWDAATGRLVTTLEGHKEMVLAVAFSADGRTLASSSGNWDWAEPPPHVPSPSEVILWDVATYQERARLPHADYVFGVAFSPAGALATAGWDGVVKVWKRESAAGAAVAPPGPQVAQAPERREDPKAAIGAIEAVQDEPDPKKEYPQEQKRSLRGTREDNPDILVYGVEADPRVAFEPEGLRIKLPPGYPGQRPGAGLVTTFGIKGDFEITVSFEILQEPEPTVPGLKTELSLVAVPKEAPEPDVWCKTNQNRASLSRQTADLKNPSRFFTVTTKWQEETPRDKWGNDILSNKELVTARDFPTGTKAGRLRLVRAGATLFFYVGEGAGDEFQLLHKDAFGAKDLKNVRVFGSTAGPQAALDVRLTDLHIRAEAFPRKSATPLRPNAHRELLLWALAPVGALVFGVLLWIGLRRRAAWSVGPLQDGRKLQQGTAASLVFHCFSCGQSLKTKAELAGKKVKCPKCGRMAPVPEK